MHTRHLQSPKLPVPSPSVHAYQGLRASQQPWRLLVWSGSSRLAFFIGVSVAGGVR